MSEAPDFDAYISEAPDFDAPDRDGLAKYLHTSKRYIEALDAKREGPPRVWIAGKWRYPMPGVKAWIKARIEIQCNAPSGESA
jgi:hypothetical protein